MSARRPIFVDQPQAGWLAGMVLSGRASEILVIDGMSRRARWGAALARVGWPRLPVRELEFDFVDDVWLPDGSRAIEQIYFKAAPVLVRWVEQQPAYGPALRAGVRRASHEPYVRAFIAKQILSEAHRTLRSILVASWYSRTRLPAGPARSILYVSDGWLFEPLAEYALRWNVELRAQAPTPLPWRGAGRRLRTWAKQVDLRLKARHPTPVRGAGEPPRIAAEMCWNGIRREPLYHTEFFWYRKPTLPPGALFGYFMYSQDQPTGDRRAALEAAGIGWVDRRTLRRLLNTPLQGERGRGGPPRPARGATPLETAVRERLEAFYAEYDRWHRFFVATGTRVHVSTYDVFASSEAVHAALADAGGVSVSLQRSIEREPYVLRRTVTDVHFAFSKAQAGKERLSGSLVRQFIAAGYPFNEPAVLAAARTRGRQIAAQLRERGVRFTLCFFDENDGIRMHRKWLGGQKLIQGDYRFLCDRLEADPTLGLVLKPKRAETLAQRLGPVRPRVERMVEAGRCFILTGLAPDERFLPCVGACAADLSVSPLYGCTTGLESYLAGTRALLIRHGVDLGPFGQLPEGSVVFDTWEALWRAVERFRADRSDPQIGNWEPIVEEFASLRDGRGAERIHQYLVWLYQAFASGKDREQALEEARQRYEAEWGPGWITAIGPEDPRPAATPVMEACPA